MPEGDTIFRTAVTLRKALVGKTVTGFQTTVGSVAAVDAHSPVAGRVVAGVEARGKHLLIRFDERPGTRDQRGGSCGSSGVWEYGSTPPAADKGAEPGCQDTVEATKGHRSGRGAKQSRTRKNAHTPTRPYSHTLVLHTHLRMTGSWHIYRPGERWRKPAHYAKVVLHTEDFVAPCFSAPVVQLLTEAQVARLPELREQGPDLMAPELDSAEARRRLRRRPELEIGVALLDQRAMAGVGNVYKCEVLYSRRVSPFLKVGDLNDETLDALVAEAHRLLRANQGGSIRRTRFVLNERERLWVYGRSGQPCLACGDTIRMGRQGMDGRSTYYCPRCQAVCG
jgi:endonuclease-8